MTERVWTTLVEPEEMTAQPLAAMLTRAEFTVLTAESGDAQPWNTINPSPPAPTRRYNYDMDITDYPPPCFPVPLYLWKDVSWTEIWDLSGSLASDIP